MIYLKDRKNIIYDFKCFLFVFPALLFYLVLFVIPNLNTFYLSFFKWNGISPNKQWVGFKNYINLFTIEPLFTQALKNSVIYALICVFVLTGVSLFLAVILQRNTVLNNLFRTVFFAPIVFSAVTVGFIWVFMFDPGMGIINTIFEKVGLGFLQRTWLGDIKTALPAVSFVHIYQSAGYGMTIFIAGLKGIPQELYEASSIEGSSGWKDFLYITLPMLTPVTLVVTVLNMIGGFKVFELIYVMTGGGPANSTQVLAMLMYDEAFNYGRTGYGSAIAVVLAVIIVIIYFIQTRIIGEKDLN